MGRQHVISENRAAGKNLPELKPRRKGLVIYFLNAGVFSLEGLQKVAHDHELVPGHKQNQIRGIGDVQIVKIVQTVGWNDRHHLSTSLAIP